MNISILMVNYHTEDHISLFLQDLLQQTMPADDFEIVIANNAQTGKLKETVAAQNVGERLNIRVIQSPVNLGFGRGMNLAAANACGEHFWIANPDLRMVQNDYLEQVCGCLNAHPDYGIAATQITNEAGKDTSERYEYEFGETLGWHGEICWFEGSSLFVRQDTFRRIGGFDRDFFMYCEDVDICLRVKKAGLPLVKINGLKVHHQGNASENADNGGKSWFLANYDKFYKWELSRMLFAYKHYPREHFEAILADILQNGMERAQAYQPTEAGFFHWKTLTDVALRIRKESVGWLYFRI